MVNTLGRPSLLPILPFTHLSLQVTPFYIKDVFLHVLTNWIWIVKKLRMSDFFRLRVLIVGLILSVWALQVAVLSPLILEFLISPTGVTTLLLPWAFFIPSSFYLSFAPSFPFLFMISCLFFNFVYHLSFFILCSFHFRNLLSSS